MKSQYYIVFILLIWSCNNKQTQDSNDTRIVYDTIHKTVFDTTFRVIKDTLKPISIPYLGNYFFSYNSTTDDLYEDTTYAHEIDTFLKRYPNDGTTFGDMRRYYRATEKLDTMIEAVYNKVYQKLKTDKDKMLFKVSQDNWKRYFASEKKFLREIYWSNQKEYGLGNEHSITQAEWTFKIGRQRLILLKNIDSQTYSGEEMK